MSDFRFTLKKLERGKIW